MYSNVKSFGLQMKKMLKKKIVFSDVYFFSSTIELPINLNVITHKSKNIQKSKKNQKSQKSLF